ncbi:MAG: HNH endonuclease [Deltaproteobacteria bacterium]|nr:MAG: HNH endonuclease [Deltaproteobacteria bacterium]
MQDSAAHAVESSGLRASRVVGAPLDLDAELAAWVRARGPVRRALAGVAGRLVATRAWERLGFARLRDYAVERVGLSARSVQDLACVDARLAELPQLEGALVSGSITWTKARLIARVATAADEHAWLVHAVEVTARELARDVRGADPGSIEAGAAETDEDGAVEEDRDTVRIRCTPVVRAKWYAARQLARRVAGEALPVWGCMEAIGAEVLSSIPLEVGFDDSTARSRLRPIADASRAANGWAPHGLPVSRGPGVRDPSSPPRAELPIFLRSRVESLDAADAFELDARLRAVVALEQRLEAELAPLLLRVRDARLYRSHGFATFEAYVRERLGISPRKARALLRLERAGHHCPALMRAYRSGQLSWVRAHALVAVLIVDRAGRWRDAWIDWARRVPVRRLEEDVERALVLFDTDPDTWCRTGGLPGCDGPQNRQTGARPTRSRETARIFFSAPRDVARLFRATLCTVRRHIERHRGPDGASATDGEALEAMLEHVFEVWGGASASGAERERVRKAHRVFERDGWRCTVPVCSSYRNLQDHHIIFRSAGGSDELGNRTTLCAWHHLRGVHVGRVRCTGVAPDALTFSLGIRDRKPPLAVYTTAPPVTRSSCDGRSPTPRGASSRG